VIKVSAQADRRDEADPLSLAMAYARYRETELKRRSHLVGHAEREAARRKSLGAGVKVAGPTPTTMPPDAVDNQDAEETEKDGVLKFEEWRKERRAHLSGPSLLISIEYVVKVSNSRFNVVYPFYLERRPVNV
jgi:hypothetical protein